MAKLFENYSTHGRNDERIVGHISPEVGKQRFLELYTQMAHFHKTCRTLGLIPRTVYHWLRYDEEFKMEFEMAKTFAATVLEDEAVRRALYGTEEPVYQGGKLVGFVTKYSDTLLITLLKGALPEKYRENWKGTLTDAQGNPLGLGSKITINHIHTDAKKLAGSEEEIEMEITNAPAAQQTEDINYELMPAKSEGPNSNDQDLIDHAE